MRPRYLVIISGMRVCAFLLSEPSLILVINLSELASPGFASEDIITSTFEWWDCTVPPTEDSLLWEDLNLDLFVNCYQSSSSYIQMDIAIK